MNRESVDAFLRDGCGRCEHYQTPACKVHLWTEPLKALRALLLETELVEEMKWGAPCYTLDGANVLMLSARKANCQISFFKGAALDDPEGALVPPGPNSRYARLLIFESLDEVQAQRPRIERFVQRAIALERAGVEVVVDDAPEPMPAELEARLESDPDLLLAFESLTPGRRRSHILYVSGAKQSGTRERRADRCAPKILAGKGFNER